VVAGFLLQLGVEVDAVLDQVGEVLAAAQRAHLRGGMPRGPRRQLVALQQDRIAEPELGQMIERRAAHNAAADDDDGGVRWKDGFECHERRAF
jgi:hypothetical protein